jgi:PAS domain S-box-containing protein
MHGYSRDELVNASPAMFIPPESMGHLEDFTTAVSRGERFHAEMAALRKGGERFLADVQGVPIEYGGTPHMLAIVRDITRRKEQEQALLDNEDRLRATVESALDCIIAMDVDGNISEFNPAAEQVFGYLRADVLGRPLSELIIPPRFREAHLRGMERLKQYGDSRNRGKRIEVVAMRADGTEFPAELAIDVANGATGQIFIGYLRDITERKNAESERNRLESQLRQAQKMEAIGHLTGGVAHDFNNILTSVMGYIIMAQERAEELADDKQLRYLSRAQRAGQRARDLIQQMLTFSRGQRGEPRPIALSPLLKECIKLLEPAMPASIEYTCSFANRLPNVLIDPLHVEQILMNLCINARDAMDGHGVLTVTLQQHRCDDCVCASCQQSIGGDYVELTVQDTGHGIPPNVLERMFEPFFSTKDVGRGSGMGLATVHGIVHEYGGHILVDSVPGKYTCFRVLLPPLQQPSDTDSTDSDFADAQDRKAHLPQCTVLIVDDEQAVTEFMQDRLEQWGLSVVIINDPLEAMRYLAGADHGIDMIILDQTMPKMTGLELAARLQEHGTAPPIVLYTGYSQEVSEETLDGAGIHALLKKPVDQNELLGILRATLSPEPGSL